MKYQRSKRRGHANTTNNKNFYKHIRLPRPPPTPRSVRPTNPIDSPNTSLGGAVRLPVNPQSVGRIQAVKDAVDQMSNTGGDAGASMLDRYRFKKMIEDPAKRHAIAYEISKKYRCALKEDKKYALTVEFNPQKPKLVSYRITPASGRDFEDPKDRNFSRYNLSFEKSDKNRCDMPTGHSARVLMQASGKVGIKNGLPDFSNSSGKAYDSDFNSMELKQCAPLGSFDWEPQGADGPEPRDKDGPEPHDKGGAGPLGKRK